MGQTLSEPVIEKFSDNGEDERLVYGLSSMQGWRISMEDAHAAVLDLQNGDTPDKTSSGERLSFFGVYDGHGGDRVAYFSGQNVHKIISKQSSFQEGNYEQALKDGFLATDRAILQEKNFEDEVSGCTASAALITNEMIYVANAGDSRTVLGIKGRAKALSFDHKPYNEAEKERIVSAGGFVDFGRVNGNLALSRAIGDFEFKKSANLPPERQIVTACPDVSSHKITDDDEFLIIACDGIWDCLSSQGAVEFVRRGIAAKHPLHTICENLMDSVLAENSDTGGVGCDNMTMVIVGLLRGKTKEEWYDMIAKRVAEGDGPCAPPEYAEKGLPAHSFNRFKNNRVAGADEFDEIPDETLFGGSDEEYFNVTPGRILKLSDGGEILTDSDDTEMFEQGKEENDDEALEKKNPQVKEVEDLVMKEADPEKVTEGSNDTKPAEEPKAVA